RCIEHALIWQMPIRDEPQAAAFVQRFGGSLNETATDIRPIHTALRMERRIRHDHIVFAMQTARDIVPMKEERRTLLQVAQVAASQIERAAFGLIHIERRDAGSAFEQLRGEIAEAGAE